MLSYLLFNNYSVHNKTFVSVSEASEVTPPCTPAVTRNPLGGGGSGGGDRLTVDEPKQNSRRISKDKENRKESRTHLYMWVGVRWVRVVQSSRPSKYFTLSLTLQTSQIVILFQLATTVNLQSTFPTFCWPCSDHWKSLFAFLLHNARYILGAKTVIIIFKNKAQPGNCWLFNFSRSRYPLAESSIF